MHLPCVVCAPATGACGLLLCAAAWGERVLFASAATTQVIKGFCDKADGKDKLTALIQVRGGRVRCKLRETGVLSPWCTHRHAPPLPAVPPAMHAVRLHVHLGWPTRQHQEDPGVGHGGAQDIPCDAGALRRGRGGGELRRAVHAHHHHAAMARLPQPMTAARCPYWMLLPLPPPPASA